MTNDNNTAVAATTEEVQLSFDDLMKGAYDTDTIVNDTITMYEQRLGQQEKAINQYEDAIKDMQVENQRIRTLLSVLTGATS